MDYSIKQPRVLKKYQDETILQTRNSIEKILDRLGSKIIIEREKDGAVIYETPKGPIVIFYGADLTLYDNIKEKSIHPDLAMFYLGDNIQFEDKLVYLFNNRRDTGKLEVALSYPRSNKVM
ncbi:MAG: hypothetical protein PHE43_01835 [Candidatus Nanoarchaeia archaeon]|nr:hypothetical protein [Candidatus Nanoarchaeia archaeon]